MIDIFIPLIMGVILELLLIIEIRKQLIIASSFNVLFLVTSLLGSQVL